MRNQGIQDRMEKSRTFLTLVEFRLESNWDNQRKVVMEDGSPDNNQELLEFWINMGR